MERRDVQNRYGEHLSTFVDGDVEATSVTLRWIPGRIVTAIQLEPGGIVHTVTADEIEAGIATIEGLASETNYTVTLKNGSKTRGVLTFMTLVDIGNAIPVYRKMTSRQCWM